MDGYGELTVEDSENTVGYVYKGDFQNSLRHGFGEAVFTNGWVYTGEWRLSRKLKGKQIYNDPERPGDIYEGEFKNDMRHGEGTYIWVNETCEGCGGEFKLSSKCNCPNIEYRCDGAWENNDRHGYGKTIYLNGDIFL